MPKIHPSCFADNELFDTGGADWTIWAVAQTYPVVIVTVLGAKFLPSYCSVSISSVEVSIVTRNLKGQYACLIERYLVDCVPIGSELEFFLFPFPLFSLVYDHDDAIIIRGFELQE